MKQLENLDALVYRQISDAARILKDTAAHCEVFADFEQHEKKLRPQTESLFGSDATKLVRIEILGPLKKAIEVFAKVNDKAASLAEKHNEELKILKF